MATEQRRLPGPSGEENRNTLTEEERRRLMEEEDLMEIIRGFNQKYGENLVIQFKDFNTNEIVFNLYLRVNEKEIMYFEPMPYSEVLGEDVKIELDANKLFDIIEYGESGRIELESPPWDKRPRVGLVKNVVDGAKMYFMFRSLMGSSIATPSSAKEEALFFVRSFFDVVMGDGENREGEDDFDEGPPEEWEDKEALTGEVVRV